VTSFNQTGFPSEPSAAEIADPSAHARCPSEQPFRKIVACRYSAGARNLLSHRFRVLPSYAPHFMVTGTKFVPGRSLLSFTLCLVRPPGRRVRLRPFRPFMFPRFARTGSPLFPSPVGCLPTSPSSPFFPDLKRCRDARLFHMFSFEASLSFSSLQAGPSLGT